MSQHIRGEFVDIAYVAYHAGATVADIHAAVARRELPTPSPNAVSGILVWNRDEVWAWIEARGVKRTLKAAG